MSKRLRTRVMGDEALTTPRPAFLLASLMDIVDPQVLQRWDIRQRRRAVNDLAVSLTLRAGGSVVSLPPWYHPQPLE